MATPARYDIRLTAGDDWQITVRLRDSDPESSDGYIDTTGYTWAAEVRTAPLPRGDVGGHDDGDPDRRRRHPRPACICHRAFCRAPDAGLRRAVILP
jgi:hypothetical protein